MPFAPAFVSPSSSWTSGQPVASLVPSTSQRSGRLSQVEGSPVTAASATVGGSESSRRSAIIDSTGAVSAAVNDPNRYSGPGTGYRLEIYGKDGTLAMIGGGEAGQEVKRKIMGGHKDDKALQNADNVVPADCRFNYTDVDSNGVLSAGDVVDTYAGAEWAGRPWRFAIAGNPAVSGPPLGG